MREILLTSSVLILAVLLLRLAFRARISRRAQYARWGLVLLRLLVPVSLGGVVFSLLSAAGPGVNMVENKPAEVTLFRAGKTNNNIQ